jgi:two-component system, OmpR family, response regulator ChvI
MALEHYGYKVDAFNDPEEALSKYKPDSYDLIILDIKMPKMDGFELYQEIKRKNTMLKSAFLLPANYIMRNLEEKNSLN